MGFWDKGEKKITAYLKFFSDEVVDCCSYCLLIEEVIFVTLLRPFIIVILNVCIPVILGEFVLFYFISSILIYEFKLGT